MSFTHEVAPVLRDAEMVIPAGSLTVITGPSGAGKTTLVDLIIGLLQPDAGEVRGRRRRAPEIAAREWRMQIGYVPQETLMLHQSVAQNVTLGDPVGAARRRAPRRCTRPEPASSSPHCRRASTPSSASAASVSRAASANAWRSRARSCASRRLLVLDEATTALDPATEREICETLRALRGTVTLVAICHHGHLVEVGGPRLPGRGHGHRARPRQPPRPPPRRRLLKRAICFVARSFACAGVAPLCLALSPHASHLTLLRQPAGLPRARGGGRVASLPPHPTHWSAVSEFEGRSDRPLTCALVFRACESCGR